MSKKREVRFLDSPELRARADGKGLEGYACLFNTMSVDMGGWREVIAPGAFKNHLAGSPDVKCLVNHSPNKILGRTTSGTLKVEEDSKGVHYDCDLPDTSAGRDIAVSVGRRDISQCSFGFIVKGQKWDEDFKDPQGVRCQLRTVTEAELLDVSPVTYPAYDQTEVNVRSLWPDGVPEDIEQRTKKEAEPDGDEPECSCRCRACYDGECEDCVTHMARCDVKSCRCNDQRALRFDKKTKRVDGEDLSSSAFLIVGDPEKTATWKLPVKFSTEAKTVSHLRNALARFGQLKDVSAEKKAAAWKRLVSLCKQHGIKVEGEDEKDSMDYTDTARCRVRVAQSQE